MSDDLPEGWAIARLGDVSRSFSGGTPSRSNPAFYGAGIPWLKSGEVRAGRIERTEEQITELGLRETSARLVRAGTPVLAMYGGGTVGTAGILTIDAAVNQAVLAIEPDLTRLNNEFCYYLLCSANQRLLSFIQGSGQANLSKAIVDAVEVVLPPLEEQQRIAEVLQSSDAHIAALTDVLSCARATKNAALIDALSTGWPETTVADLLAETRYPMRSGPFGSALLKSELQAEGIPFLGIDNVQVERFVPTYRRFISEEKYRELARYTVFPGDVMVTIMGTIGRCCVVPEGVGTAISSKHVWTITLDRDRYSPALLAWQINQAPWVLDQLRGESQGGIMSAISSGTLRDLVIPLPPQPELRRIEQLLLSFNEFISTTEAELERTQATKAAIADDLLSGRVRVPVATEKGPRLGIVQPAFKRAVFAAEIVHQLHADARFGSVKHEKIVHLCELHLGLQKDLDRHAYKEAAGPYDPKARRSVEGIFRQQKWFDATKANGARVVYQTLPNSGGHTPYFDRYFGERRAEIQALIDLLRPMTTQQCEIVATLYSVWNDLLIERKAATDKEVVQSVLNNWHPSKQQIAEERWLSALPWMRRHGLIPIGQGEKTRVPA